MPCVYEETESERRARLRRQTENEKQKRLKQKKIKSELDLATRLLCQICTRLEKSASHIKLANDLLNDEDLSPWWKRHKAVDECRKKREDKVARARAKKVAETKKLAEMKKKALGKLTAKERKSLGL